MTRIAVLVLALAFVARFAIAADQAYVQGISDLPLMPGLTEVPGAGTVFDKPGGRIVQAYATGNGMDANAVRRFYADTLPGLGWHRETESAFVREHERLRLTVAEDKGTLTVRFDVAPR
ncbi:MAG TPA: hypothetical protein VEU47_14160 [Candidatus Cybelea sp.]|nr:hypothetical protein [Candidatus Cybelea sp.]